MREIKQIKNSLCLILLFSTLFFIEAVQAKTSSSEIQVIKNEKLDRVFLGHLGNSQR